MKKLLLILTAAVLGAQQGPSYSNAAVTSAVVVRTAPGTVFGGEIVNPNTSTCWLQFYNSQSPTLGSNVIVAVPVMGTSSGSVEIEWKPPFSLWFSNSISIAATTTPTGNTTCSTGLSVTLYAQ